MDAIGARSFFEDIRSRELNGFRVRKRPYPVEESSKFKEIGVLAVEHDDVDTPPTAVSFCKTSSNSHILAVTGEDGHIGLYNTRLKFPSQSVFRENTEKARVCEWNAHDNAIFDACWIKDDTNILTASADQCIKVWDPQEKKCIATLIGHTGSVKSVSPHATNPDLLVSGSRDGSFRLWDMRSTKRRNGHISVSSHAEVTEAHSAIHGRRLRRGKAASMSITSVIFLKDEISIATAGAVDSVVKFWDIRNLKCPIIQSCPDPDLSTGKKRRLYGISSLSQDLNGMYISASCRDNSIYLYNVLQLEKGPIKSFSGSRIESFFVKSALSPDAAHILGGSSDGNAYIWQVNKPESDPTVIEGHDGEVTAVDWCQSEVGKIATSSDDYTVRLWNIQNSCYSTTRSPSSIRRRVSAMPKMERRKLFADDEPAKPEKDFGSSSSDEASCKSISSPRLNIVAEFGTTTPKSQEKRSLAASDSSKEAYEMTPEAALQSPSSVLNPPSSLKRKTILDYFVTSS